MGTESWKKVEGWPYQISDQGRAARVLRSGRRRYLKGSDVCGYIYVDMRDGPRRRSVGVHVLVLEAFVGPAPQGQETRHLNGCKTDNRLENLCWGTRQENATDKVRHGTHLVGERHPSAKLTEAQAQEIVDSGEGPSALAARFGVSRSMVDRIRRGVAWPHLQRPDQRNACYARGDSHHSSKLDAVKVRAIRESEEPSSVLAARFGVSKVSINNVRARRTWAHVEDNDLDSTLDETDGDS